MHLIFVISLQDKQNLVHESWIVRRIKKHENLFGNCLGKINETWQNKLKNAVARSGEKNREHICCGCQARMTIVKFQGGDIWAVSYFIEQCNHALATPSKVYLLRSHYISWQPESSCTTFLESQYSYCQQVWLFEINARGSLLIGCLEKDIRNHKRHVRSELFGHEIETLIQHFKTKKERN